MLRRPRFTRRAAALALAGLGCKDPSLYQEGRAMSRAAQAVLRAHGHCPPPAGQCGGHNLFATAENGKAVYITLYAIPDPAAIAEVIDSCAALSLRLPSRPAVELRVYALPHLPPTRNPNEGASATAQAPVFRVSMRHP